MFGDFEHFIYTKVFFEKKQNRRILLKVLYELSNLLVLNTKDSSLNLIEKDMFVEV